MRGLGAAMNCGNPMCKCCIAGDAVANELRRQLEAAQQKLFTVQAELKRAPKRCHHNNIIGDCLSCDAESI